MTDEFNLFTFIINTNIFGHISTAIFVLPVYHFFFFCLALFGLKVKVKNVSLSVMSVCNPMDCRLPGSSVH